MTTHDETRVRTWATTEEVQADHPLPDGWRWFHDEDGWNALEDDSSRTVYVDGCGLLYVDVADAYDPRAAPQDVALSVLLVSMWRGSLASIEQERDDAMRAVCERACYGRPGHESAGDYDTPQDAARDIYPNADLHPPETTGQGHASKGDDS